MANANARIEFEHQGIGTILSNYRLAVPVNQREYSWEREHVEDLLNDFNDSIASNKSTYFLGTIVLTTNPVTDIPEVADGQQRLATTTILLSVIRDFLYSTGEEIQGDSVEHDFLNKLDRETREIVPRLRLNTDDNTFFAKTILSKPTSPDRNTTPTKRSHERIQQAQKIAKEKIQKVVDLAHKPKAINSRLLEWVKFIETAAQVIVLQVPDEVNAFMMFETLNDRGLKASQADLLKNYLLGQAGDQIKYGQAKWAKMQGALEFRDDDVTVVFLHHLLISKHGPMREREVYDKVRQVVNSPSRSVEFLDELADAAKDYAALFNPNAKKWNPYGVATTKHLVTINRDLQVQQIRPLMFAVARKFPVKEAQQAFRLFVYWSVRFLFVGGRGGNLDRLYGFLSQDVANGKITTAAGLVAKIGDSVPSDAVFEPVFADGRVPSARLARYYLRALEQTVKEQDEPSHIPNDDNTVINLEHVLPENPGKGWSHIDAAQAEAFHKYLGNMVLLQVKANTRVGNSSFAAKKSVLGASAYELTREVADFDSWGIEQIRERQKRLAKLALKTWPLTP